jgi:hypothetical protein
MSGQRWFIPRRLDVVEHSGHVNKVDRAMSDHLVGDAHVATGRVADPGDVCHNRTLYDSYEGLLPLAKALV